ncbi:transcription factor and DNA repair complex, core TFIIH [Purpureocillium lavendulum]|uniref:General transcription and DNA repair factor IIH n=1 Tax=Purpureocillium lavendulum TaxID=1247861 RepID=A0AB34FSQ1_9HYPO|nr:transcription factor and DNA repair complex, core TFIIH [Purpureocillium lavendulum]
MDPRKCSCILPTTLDRLRPPNPLRARCRATEYHPRDEHSSSIGSREATVVAMADSDGEFVADGMSDDDLMEHNVSDDNVETTGRPSRGKSSRSRRKGGQGSARAWEQSKRSWETNLPEEDQNGVLNLTALEAEKRKRLLRDTTPLQRGIIRHMVLVLDMSFAMAEKDLLPTRYRLTLSYAAAFVKEFFEQNPISQLGIVGMRDGVAVRISDLGGNPAEHLEKLKEIEGQDPQGNPSLQNALEMCRGALFHAPSHGTREVLIIYGALLSSDPGDIHETISSLITDRIRVSIVGLSAQVAICAELCSRTNAGDDSQYNVAMDEVHFRDLFLAATTPPVTRTQEQSTASLLMMGFPSRTLAPGGSTSYCACHNKPCREGYACTRCSTRVCRLPAECPACGLTLILSTHLARSYHHLFPLRSWVEVSWADAGRSTACFSCLCPFPEVSRASLSAAKGKEEHPKTTAKGVSESGRYACEVCGNHFCIDCDVFAHEVIHNCPGCQSNVQGHEPTEVNGHTNGAMEVDS